jgi:hypothetical protein
MLVKIIGKYYSSHFTTNSNIPKMKSYLLACIFLGLTAQAFADDLFEQESAVDEAAGRFLYFNTSSTATSLTLLGALILLGVIGYLIYAGGLLGGGSETSGYGQSYNRNDFYGQEQYGQYDGQYAQYR